MSESLTAKVQRMHSPINRAAASVIGGGIHYDEAKLNCTGETVRDDPFPVRPYPRSAPKELDLTGRIIGRFHVMGLSLSVGKSWVVHCSCGSYCLRKRSSLLSETGVTLAQKMCPRCMQKELKKRKQSQFSEVRNTLRAAQLPMYAALLEILKRGLTDSTRRMAEDAIAIALGKKRSDDDMPNSNELVESLKARTKTVA